MKSPTPVVPPAPPATPAAPKIAMVPTFLDISGTTIEDMKKVQAEYQTKIALLEQELVPLRARLAKPDVIRETQVIVQFTRQDIGNWDAAELAAVIAKLMFDDVKAKKYGDMARLTLDKDSLYASGSPVYIADVTAWVKKLKK